MNFIEIKKEHERREKALKLVSQIKDTGMIRVLYQNGYNEMALIDDNTQRVKVFTTQSGMTKEEWRAKVRLENIQMFFEYIRENVNESVSLNEFEWESPQFQDIEIVYL